MRQANGVKKGVGFQLLEMYIFLYLSKKEVIMNFLLRISKTVCT